MDMVLDHDQYYNGKQVEMEKGRLDKARTNYLVEVKKALKPVSLA